MAKARFPTDIAAATMNANPARTITPPFNAFRSSLMLSDEWAEHELRSVCSSHPRPNESSSWVDLYWCAMSSQFIWQWLCMHHGELTIGPCEACVEEPHSAQIWGEVGWFHDNYGIEFKPSGKVRGEQI